MNFEAFFAIGALALIIGGVLYLPFFIWFRVSAQRSKNRGAIVGKTVPDLTDPDITSLDRILNFGYCLFLLGICLYFWWAKGEVAFLIGAMGFLVLAPLKYRVPASMKRVFGHSRNRLIRRGSFSQIDVFLSLIGYSLLLVAIIVGAFTLLW